MRRKQVERASRRSACRDRTPAPARRPRVSAPMKSGDRSGEPKPSTIRSICDAARAAARAAPRAVPADLVLEQDEGLDRCTSRSRARGWPRTQRGKNCLAVLQQARPVAVARRSQRVRVRAHSAISAASGAWSDSSRPRPARQRHRRMARARCARRCGPARAAGSGPGRSARRGHWPARTPRAGRRSAARMRCARPRQSLKSPATISGASAGTCVADDLAQQLELAAAVRLLQAQVHADRMHVDARSRARAARSAAGRASRGRRSRRRGSVGDDRKLRQHRVAVVAARDTPRCGRRRTAARSVGEEFVVRRLGPVGDARGVARRGCPAPPAGTPRRRRPRARLRAAPAG